DLEPALGHRMPDRVVEGGGQVEQQQRDAEHDRGTELPGVAADRGQGDQHRATGERGGRADAVGQGAGDLVAHARQALGQAALADVLSRLPRLTVGTAHAPYVTGSWPRVGRVRWPLRKVASPGPARVRR